MTDILSVWGNGLLFFFILLVLPVAVPVLTVKLIRKVKIKKLKKAIIITLAAAIEILIVAAPWTVFVKDGVGEWLLLLAFYFGVTLITLGPVILIVAGAAMFYIKYKS